MMLGLKDTWQHVRQSFYDDFTLAGLKTIIVLWALFIIFVVLFVVDNKWILAGILAYEVLP